MDDVKSSTPARRFVNGRLVNSGRRVARVTAMGDSVSACEIQAYKRSQNPAGKVPGAAKTSATKHSSRLISLLPQTSPIFQLRTQTIPTLSPN